MKRISLILLATITFLIVLDCNGPKLLHKTMNPLFKSHPVHSVDPFIGTDFFAHTFPGATLPFAMVALSPDEDNVGWNYSSGYQYADHSIMGFSHTHFSGTGWASKGDILIMPTIGDRIQVRPGPKENPDEGYRSRFSHADETAWPGYYAVRLSDYNIRAELTVTRRTGFHRYTFPKANNAHILIDLGHAIGKKPTGKSHIEIVSNTRIEGYKLGAGVKIFFVAEFSKPFAASGTWDARYKTPESGGRLFPYKTAESGQSIGAFINFRTEENETVLVKVGLSYVDITGARNNLKAEIPGWDFDSVRKNAEKTWSKELGKIKITGTSKEQKQIFYTALYHTLVAQQISNDVDGRYPGMDGKVYKTDGHDFYPSFFAWDTFRSEYPLMTIVEPEHVNDMIKSIELKCRHYGWLPAQHVRNLYGQGMVGDHLVPIIVDAYIKGFRGFDAEYLYNMMRAKATELPTPPLPASNARPALKDYLNLGYIPADRHTESVSNTLESAYDDWCIAQMAKMLGKKDDYASFTKRAKNYKNVFDPTTKFMRPKKADGTWLKLCDGEPEIIHNGDHSYYGCFDPLWVGRWPNRHYTESNAWQYIWFVPQDVPGLIDLFGGREQFAGKLDTLFSMSPEIHGPKYIGVVGTIGQYVQGNQPSHHVAYLYDYAGEPWKTQEKVRKVMDDLYRSGPGGICGNEDMGSLSSWFVFSAMGFYPVCPGSNVYAIGTPLFKEARIKLGELHKGDEFVIKAVNVSATNKYIQSATLNGAPLEKPFITHKDIVKGGTLTFEMDDQPNKAWGR
ncbi:MAG: glycoside hydrolase family 92 protein [Actinobacteria bacterium]|nr:glycoside hydrolase family 92 protein [Actinomycetota bacterium]